MKEKQKVTYDKARQIRRGEKEWDVVSKDLYSGVGGGLQKYCHTTMDELEIVSFQQRFIIVWICIKKDF